MYTEKNQKNNKEVGCVEVICGSMFSGKTEELMRRMNRAKLAKQSVEIYKHTVDSRYDSHNIVSHDMNQLPSTPVASSTEILLYTNDSDVIGIDEAQFFDNELVNVCNTLANRGVRVIIAGLDMDYMGKPFGPMPSLLAMADEITKLHAICIKCGKLALYTHRIIKDEALFLIGEKESYEPLCRECYKEISNNQK